jgi:hypothetical protein
MEVYGITLNEYATHTLDAIIPQLDLHDLQFSLEKQALREFSHTSREYSKMSKEGIPRHTRKLAQRNLYAWRDEREAAEQMYAEAHNTYRDLCAIVQLQQTVYSTLMDNNMKTTVEEAISALQQVTARFKTELNIYHTFLEAAKLRAFNFEIELNKR